MNLKRLFESKEDKVYRISWKSAGKAFYSSKEQMRLAPLNRLNYTSNENARCRLGLYSMNAGYISWLLVLRMGEEGKEISYDFHKNFVLAILQEDIEVANYIEDLIFDKQLLTKIKRRISDNNNDNQFIFGKYLLNKEQFLFSCYLLDRMMEYHNAVADKFQTMKEYDSRYVNPDLLIDQVTKLFVKDYFGKDYMENYEFSAEFTQNISMQSFTVLSDEIREILS